MPAIGNHATYGLGPVGVEVALSTDLAVINLPICVTPDAPDRRSELNLLRDALQFYAEHLEEQSNRQQQPAMLIDAANVNDMLENLTQLAFDALSERSQLLLTHPSAGHEEGER